MTLPNTGERIYRLPAWITYVTQDLSVSATYDAIFWHPEQDYTFKHPRPKRPRSIRVYEAHGNPQRAFIHTVFILSL